MNCREEVEDELRSGRPITETTSEKVDQIRLLINGDDYFIIEESQEQTDLSYARNSMGEGVSEGWGEV
ncbi:hypothetical protein I4U23_000070 [Adineta vaga]|nr:hypothetical protein I4U23_000070 [Adineta vaga]